MQSQRLAPVVGALILAAPLLATPAQSHDDPNAIRADGHAPIGVMGDHLHKAGEFMFSYRYMNMQMEGSRDGTTSLSPTEIATTVPNRFFGTPGQPPTLRVVPTEMTMQMHMLGMMYAPTDRLTLMVMGMYRQNSMDHITFQGGMGTAQLGTFTTKSSGFGDTRVAGLIGLYQDNTHRLHLNAGVSLPTGSITEEDQVLTPMGTRPTLRLPYPMQLGSGTVDLMPGITYAGATGAFGWGAQAMGTLRLGRNGEGYSLGDGVEATVWASYSPFPWISVSGRVKGSHLGQVDGQDPRIVAPVQTADPDNQGGTEITLFGGLNLVGQDGFLRGQRLAFEVGVPVYRRLNGPQLETDVTFQLGYQVAF